MLKFLDELSVFIEDSQSEVHVRAYARIKNISAPTAAKTLAHYHKEGILEKRIDKRHHCYQANIRSSTYKDLCRLYWRERLEDSGLIKAIENSTVLATIVLFGSLTQGTAGKGSDIDLAIFTPTQKLPGMRPFETKLGRTIQIIHTKDLASVKNQHLRRNIYEQGVIIRGNWFEVAKVSFENEASTKE